MCKGRLLETCKASLGYIPELKNLIKCNCAESGPHKIHILIQYDDGRIILGCVYCGIRR